jgi:HlyD family secretion protein
VSLNLTRCIAVALLLLAPLVASCGSKEEHEPSPVVSVQAGVVEQKTIQDKIETDAILYPLDQAAIVPKVVAPIKKLYVQRGSQVHAGQLLAELENQDLAGAVTENRGGFEQAQASYQNAQQSTPQDLQVAKDQLDATQKLYDSRQELYKQGAMAAKDVQDASIALAQAHNQYEIAQNSYNLKTAQGQLTAARGRAASAEAQLSYSKIVSPINGVITDRPFYVGETPPSGSPVLTVMDLSSVIARADLSPHQAAELRVGDAASVSSGEGQPEIEGKVTVVSPALNPNSTTIQVWVQVPNPGDRLKSGSTVHLSIVAKTIKNALVVPAAAILTNTDGTNSVMTIGSDGVAHQTAIKTGARDGDEVQILSGLPAGQQIVITGAYGLPDGTKVTVSKSSEPSGSEKD